MPGAAVLPVGSRRKRDSLNARGGAWHRSGMVIDYVPGSQPGHPTEGVDLRRDRYQWAWEGIA